jgi:hypothetical protein
MTAYLFQNRWYRSLLSEAHAQESAGGGHDQEKLFFEKEKLRRTIKIL